MTRVAPRDAFQFIKTNARINEMPHSPLPGRVGDLSKFGCQKPHPWGQSKFEAGLQFALNDDSLGKFVLRNCCQQQTCVVCHRLGKL